MSVKQRQMKISLDADVKRLWGVDGTGTVYHRNGWKGWQLQVIFNEKGEKLEIKQVSRSKYDSYVWVEIQKERKNGNCHYAMARIELDL